MHILLAAITFFFLIGCDQLWWELSRRKRGLK